MKLKYLAIVLMALFCLNGYGQQQKAALKTAQPNKELVEDLQETVSQLQAENNALYQKLDKLSEEVELYRGDVRNKVDEINSNLDHWLVFLTIVVGLIGILLGAIAPLWINSDNRKRMESRFSEIKNDFKGQLDIATTKAEDAKIKVEEVTEQVKLAQKTVSEIEDIKKHIDEINKIIKADKHAAENAAREAQASQLFAQALSETDASTAIELYTKAIEYNPDDWKSYNNRGLLKVDTGDKEGAMKDYDKAIELNPKNAKAFYNRGLLKKNTGDKNGAMKDYDKAIELDPKFAKAYNNRGLLKKNTGDKNGAMKDYDKAIELDPKIAKAYNNRGNLKKNTEDKEGAMKDFDKAIELDPNNALHYNNRGLLKVDTGDKEGAMKDYDKAIELDPNNALYYNLRGNLKKNTEDKAGAMKDFDKAIELDPNNALYYNNRERLKKEMGDKEENNER